MLLKWALCVGVCYLDYFSIALEGTLICDVAGPGYLPLGHTCSLSIHRLFLVKCLYDALFDLPHASGVQQYHLSSTSLRLGQRSVAVGFMP